MDGDDHLVQGHPGGQMGQLLRRAGDGQPCPPLPPESGAVVQKDHRHHPVPRGEGEFFGQVLAQLPGAEDGRPAAAGPALPPEEERPAAGQGGGNQPPCQGKPPGRQGEDPSPPKGVGPSCPQGHPRRCRPAGEAGQQQPAAGKAEPGLGAAVQSP